MDAFEIEQADKAILRRLGLEADVVHVDEDGLGWIEVEPGSFTVVNVNESGASGAGKEATMAGKTLSKKDQASGKSRTTRRSNKATDAEVKKATNGDGETSTDLKAAAAAADAKAKSSSTSKPKDDGPKQISAREAAIKVLKKADGPMKSKDIIAEGVKIAKHLKDPHAIQVALFTGAKKGRDFKNVEKGVYDLIDR